MLPWSDVAVSGWVLDPDRKKMSKSKGNVVTPVKILEEHGSDAVRYWAASGRPGVDTAFEDSQIKVGRRLAIKILNASRFALGAEWATKRSPAQKPFARHRPRHALRPRPGARRESTCAFESYDYARALERTEAFFWSFCDDYLELVKARATSRPSAREPPLAARRTGGSLVGPTANVRPLPPLRDRGGLVVVARRLHPQSTLARGFGAGSGARRR